MTRALLIALIVVAWSAVAMLSCTADDVIAADRVAILPPYRREVLPIPEPDTWLLMGLGVAVVAWWARRR